MSFYSVSNNQVAEIQSRAGKVQGRVVELQEKVQKHNPKKEKLRKFILDIWMKINEYNFQSQYLNVLATSDLCSV